ncbi:MAG: hypothetical protein ACTSSJ_01565 [Candidatus Odinarchaeia archaeon]
MPDGRGKLTKALLKSIRDTYLALEDKEEWIKTSEKDLIAALREIDFDEIIASRDVIECYIDGTHVLSICKKNGEFFVKNELSTGKTESLQQLVKTLAKLGGK